MKLVNIVNGVPLRCGKSWIETVQRTALNKADALLNMTAHNIFDRAAMENYLNLNEKPVLKKYCGALELIFVPAEKSKIISLLIR